MLDRHYLKYLNLIERLNCDYCSYFNGLASYTTEIAARSEQYCVQLSMPPERRSVIPAITGFSIMEMLMLTAKNSGN